MTDTVAPACSGARVLWILASLGLLTVLSLARLLDAELYGPGLVPNGIDWSILLLAAGTLLTIRSRRWAVGDPGLWLTGPPAVPRRGGTIAIVSPIHSGTGRAHDPATIVALPGDAIPVDHRSSRTPNVVPPGMFLVEGELHRAFLEPQVFVRLERVTSCVAWMP